MRFYRNQCGYLSGIIAIAIAIVTFNTASYAQFSVSINGSFTTPTTAPTGEFSVSATASTIPSTLEKIVFFRNDVPYKTFTGSSKTQEIEEDELGQDTYTYRARAYDLNGTWADSAEIKLTVETPRVFKMGDVINGIQTRGPDRNFDHFDHIQAAVNYIGNFPDGGTLFFPCTGGLDGDQQSIYNISKPITIPSNVTLQGESSEEGIWNGRCRIYWNDDLAPTNPACYEPPSNDPLRGKAMFKIEGKSRVRFRDLWMISRTIGRDCGSGGSSTQIENDNTTAILLDAQSTGNISDIIIENVSISAFTYGIKAIGNSISDIKMRGVRPSGNHRQLSIDAKYAYDWDVQNFNINFMTTNQGGVEIKNAGAPTSYTGENKKLKFLLLNCNGDGSVNYEDKPEFCVSIEKHGGLYFRQLHYEGTKKSIFVKNIGTKTNDEPIILENSAATGEFNDDSMQLYLIGNGIIAAPDPQAAQQQNHPDKRRMEFLGDGLQSTVVDCGDVHWDRTDTFARKNPTDPIGWGDWRMLFTHSERNRGSFFVNNYGYSFVKPHTICPKDDPDPEITDINEVGGEHFNTGILPMDIPSSLYSGSIEFGSPACTSAATCAAELLSLLNSPTNRGTVYIIGSVPVNQTITIPSGRQIVGVEESELVLEPEICSDLICNPDILLRININSGTRTSGNVIRNLKLKTSQTNTVGLAIIAANSTTAEVSSDMHFSGLVIEGFDTGLLVAPYSHTSPHPMVDGLSWKNIHFVNNKTAASIFSSNLSNWNIMNLRMESTELNAVGWHQITSGTSMQNVTCRATANTMEHCIKLDTSGIYLTGLKKTENVTNALTIGVNGILGHEAPYTSLQFASLVLRNNDFSSLDSGMSRINITGKAYIVSMNNKYSHFNVTNGSEAKFSRLTYCKDSFDNGTLTPNDDGVVYPGLEDYHTNLYVGVLTKTRVGCGTRPIPWEDAVRWGGEEEDDQPLVGNFYHDVREDLVIYREKTLSEFRIKESGGTGTIITQLGTVGDIPLIGRFYPNQRAQVLVWTPSTGYWMAKDPNTSASYSWQWGMNGDVPFVGNFFDESDPNMPNPVSGNMDEIAIYRPSNQTVWIRNPRSGDYYAFSRGSDYGNEIQIGDFWGLDYDQIAQFKINGSGVGVWSLVDPQTFTTASINFGQTGDIPVAGKYLSGNCTQLGVWRPSTEQFIIMNPFSACGSQTPVSMRWGSNNDLAGSTATDDIPLTIKTEDGLLDRPVAYRPTKGTFQYSIANGQWWIHDPF